MASTTFMRVEEVAEELGVSKSYAYTGGYQMTQKERRFYLIKELLKEQTQYAGIKIPTGEQDPCSIFECHARPVRNFWRYRTLICRRKSGVRE